MMGVPMADPTPLPDGHDPADVEDSLRHLGANTATAADLIAHAAEAGRGAPALPGRVARAERSGAEVATASGPVRATWDEPVSTGDWVVVTGPPDHESPGHIVYLQPRRTAFVRRSADVDRPQVLAANIDEVWIVVPADAPLSPPRLERTLVLAWESGSEPVLVLTKADLAGRPALHDARRVMEGVGPGVPVVAVSSVTGKGMDTLTARVGPGRTAALLGSSGAGKSSLVNAMVGAEVAAVGEVRDTDRKGRHTTSWRELVVLPAGGALIDTPGLRGVGMWVDAGGLAAAFSDITALARECRFSDCAHDTEPGCAVRAAIAAGILDRRRLDSYDKLRQEAAESGARNQSRIDAQAKRVEGARAASIRARDRRRD
jgi:ribosome biogenesis GTPase